MDCIYKEGCNGKDCDKGFCLRKYKLDNLFEKSLLDIRQRRPIKLYVDQSGTDLVEFKQLAGIIQDIESFVKNGNNLFIHSANCGNGKTSWAVKVIQAYINKIWPKADLECKALFVSVPRFLQALKDNISVRNDYAQYIKNNALTADLVVWDEVGAKAGTEFEITQLYSLIDSRIAAGKSNIYTANVEYKAIAATLGERLASRICLNSTDIEFHGADKRNLGGNK